MEGVAHDDRPAVGGDLQHLGREKNIINNVHEIRPEVLQHGLNGFEQRHVRQEGAAQVEAELVETSHPVYSDFFMLLDLERRGTIFRGEIGNQDPTRYPRVFKPRA